MAEKRRPGSIMGDDERADMGAKHRRRTSPGGVPVLIENDHTPAPVQLPLAQRVEGYPSIPSPTRDALETIADEVRDLVDQQHDRRHDEERFKHIEFRLERGEQRNDRVMDVVLAVDETLKANVMPALVKQDKILDILMSDREHDRPRDHAFHTIMLPDLTRKVEGILPRLDKLERTTSDLATKQEAQGLGIQGVAAQVQGMNMLSNTLEKKVMLIDTRVDRLETDVKRDVQTVKGEIDSHREAVKTGTLAAIQNDGEQTKRLTACEDRLEQLTNTLATKEAVALATAQANKWWLAKLVAVGSSTLLFLFELGKWLYEHAQTHSP